MNYLDAIQYLKDNGYELKEDGRLFKDGIQVEKKLVTKKGSSYYGLFVQKYRTYLGLGRWQLLNKFGPEHVNDKYFYLDKNNLNISIDNIELLDNLSNTRPETLVCRKCGRELPKEMFNLKNRNSGLRQTICRDCLVEYRKEIYDRLYPENRERRLVNRKENEAKCLTTKLVLEHKIRGCCCCGEKDPYCMEFHHLDPSTKKFNIGDALDHKYNDVEDELKKCIVLCANCHRKLHNKYDGDIEELLSNEQKKA